MISDLEVVLRLVLSAVAGGIVGMEREANNRPAGFRTHILVSLGSALIMLISMYGFDGLGGDPARLAAQVVSGIGFLGAGTIMRTGSNIKGLTTAASIWVCGGIGLAIGNGYYLGGIATSIIIMLTLKSSNFIQMNVFRSQNKLLVVESKERAGLIGDIGYILGKNNIVIKDIRVNSEDHTEDYVEEEDYTIEVIFMVKLPSKPINNNVFDEILNIDGVENVVWDGNLQKRRRT